MRQLNAASAVSVGDLLVCYMTKLSRWVGLLEVRSERFIDKSPIFYPEDDPFVVRFRVNPIVLLPKEKGIPIHEDQVWNRLSFTRGLSKTTSQWTGKLRHSLIELSAADGKFLEGLIQSQNSNGHQYPVDEGKYAKLVSRRIRRPDKSVAVTVPEKEEVDIESADVSGEVRESAKIQAMLARIGETMGFNIWIPRNDRSKILREWTPAETCLLENLPLNYDDTTIKTIEQIDVLWLKGRAIVRAFEVEHTTAVYSGILRMADLMALQPNMDIKLHIVAPYSRRDKVFQEIQRPVFSLLDRGPLSGFCTFISYDSVVELSKQRHLTHLSDAVVEEYAEEVE
jgi:hypothetical protein